jgi:hypothetical protein
MTTEERAWAVVTLLLAAVGTYFAYEQAVGPQAPAAATETDENRPPPVAPPPAPAERPRP